MVETDFQFQMSIMKDCKEVRKKCIKTSMSVVKYLTKLDLVFKNNEINKKKLFNFGIVSCISSKNICPCDFNLYADQIIIELS